MPRDLLNFVGRLFKIHTKITHTTMQNNLRLFVASAAMGLSMMVMAQTTVKGRMVDAETGEPLIGANVKLLGEQTNTVTDVEGGFTLQNPRKRREISVSYIGFKTTNFTIDKSGQMGTLQLEPNDINLEGVTVVGTLGLDRKTPVALSTLSSEEIEERMGTQEFPYKTGIRGADKL